MDLLAAFCNLPRNAHFSMPCQPPAASTNINLANAARTDLLPLRSLCLHGPAFAYIWFTDLLVVLTTTRVASQYDIEEQRDVDICVLGLSRRRAR